MKKRLILMVLCVFSLLMLLTPFVKYDVKAETAPGVDTTQIRAVGENFMSEWVGYDFTTPVDEFKAKYPTVNYVFQLEEEFLTWYSANKAVLDKVGKYVEIDNESVEFIVDKDIAKLHAKAKCENGVADLSILFDLAHNKVTLTAETVPTLAEVLEKAALNTAFGMFFIFAVLIFISLVIKALSILPKLFAPKEAPKAEVVNTPAPAPVVEAEADLSDEELTAVMTAAIMAYMAENEEAPADGLFVRSIKRRNVSAWKRG